MKGVSCDGGCKMKTAFTVRQHSLDSYNNFYFRLDTDTRTIEFCWVELSFTKTKLSLMRPLYLWILTLYHWQHGAPVWCKQYPLFLWSLTTARVLIQQNLCGGYSTWQHIVLMPSGVWCIGQGAPNEVKLQTQCRDNFGGPQDWLQDCLCRPEFQSWTCFHLQENQNFSKIPLASRTSCSTSLSFHKGDGCKGSAEWDRVAIARIITIFVSDTNIWKSADSGLVRVFAYEQLIRRTELDRTAFVVNSIIVKFGLMSCRFYDAWRPSPALIAQSEMSSSQLLYNILCTCVLFSYKWHNAERPQSLQNHYLLWWRQAVSDNALVQMT